jgi:hypothetical protein
MHRGCAAVLLLAAAQSVHAGALPESTPKVTRLRSLSRFFREQKQAVLRAPPKARGFRVGGDAALFVGLGGSGGLAAVKAAGGTRVFLTFALHINGGIGARGVVEGSKSLKAATGAPFPELEEVTADQLTGIINFKRVVAHRPESPVATSVNRQLSFGLMALGDQLRINSYNRELPSLAHANRELVLTQQAEQRIAEANLAVQEGDAKTLDRRLAELDWLKQRFKAKDPILRAMLKLEGPRARARSHEFDLP